MKMKRDLFSPTNSNQSLRGNSSDSTERKFRKYNTRLELADWGSPKRRGQLVTEEAEIAITTSFIRKSLSVCAVRSQARLLLGRLEVIGPGAAAAAQRRNIALQLERRWANQRRADALSVLQGRAILRRGHFKLD